MGSFVSPTDGRAPASDAEPDPARDEPGHPGDEPDRVRAPRTRIRIDDRVARGVGIPVFGLLIPQLTGLLGPLEVGEPLYLGGVLWFIGLALAVWEGNRWLLFRQRQHWDWFQHPVRKLTFLLAATVFYTAPLTVGWLWLWYRVAPMPFDAGVVQTVALANTICVVFVTHGYETAFLIRERGDDHLDQERLLRAKAEAELSALRAQIDPHFMFNALNTLAQLVEDNPARAVEFTESLADVYRYVLAQRERDLVLLREEVSFLERYVFLLRIRLGDALSLAIDDPEERAGTLLVPPMALQLLVENVAKHNRMDEPMQVHVRVTEGAIVVENPRRPKAEVMSSGLGLENLSERCQLLMDRPLVVHESEATFAVRLPTLELSA
ncbi:MAG: sensor histidine kinase [Sandaracinaceae bacterium]